jgi:hypothetical protein
MRTESTHTHDDLLEFEMKILALVAAPAAGLLLTLGAHAQVFGTDNSAAARAERRTMGAEAARGPQMGEGNPIPEPEPRVTPEDRATARAERSAIGAEAARGPQMGEGDPIPQARPRMQSTDRSAARRARAGEATRANKEGEIKSKGEKSY